MAAATLWAAHNTHIVHYPLRGWKLFNLVATIIGKHTSGGHNELALPEEVLPFFSHYCEMPTKLMRTPKEFRRWMLLHREPVDNWIQGRVALLGDAAHFMLQYMAQGAAMAMEDAVCLGACVDAADGDFEQVFRQLSEEAHRARHPGADLGQQAGRHDLPRARRPRARGAQRHVPRPQRRAALRRAGLDLQRAGLRARLQGAQQVGADLGRPSARRKAASRAPARSAGSRARAARPARRPPSRRTASRAR